MDGVTADPMFNAAAAALGAEKAVHAKVPSDDQESSEEKRQRGEDDPWSNSDPWSEVKDGQPSFEEYQRFCAWLKSTRQPEESSGKSSEQAWWTDRQWHEYGAPKSSSWNGWKHNGYEHPAERRRRRRAWKASEEEDRDDPPDEKRQEKKKKDGSGGGNPPEAPGGAPSDPDEEEDSASSVRTAEVRSLLMKKWKQGERPKSSLGSVKIEDFYGERTKYRGWKRVVKAQQQLYQLDESELSMLIYLSCKKEARDVLEQMILEDMVKPGGLASVWALLDDAYNETNEEQFERVEQEFQMYRRTPGQTVASYISQIKRLKAEYLREDPDTRFSDRAWAQRLLVRASLSKRERLDVFFSAGGIYESRAIERALRHRCQRLHEEERRVPVSSAFKRPTRFSSRPSSMSSATASSTPSTTASSGYARYRKKVSAPPVRGTHVASIEEEELDDDEDEAEDEDLEQDPEAYEAYLQQGPNDECEDEEGTEDEDPDSITSEQLKEAYAAGWKAKDQINAKRRGRSFSQSGATSSRGPKKGPDPRKAATTCSSCGQLGHWKGDPQCPNVQTGVDKPFQPKKDGSAGKGKIHYVNYVQGGSALQTHEKPVEMHEKAIGEKGVKVHEVNFAFVATRTEAPAKSRVTEPGTCMCSACQHVVKTEDRFCASCGVSLAAVPMTDKEKRTSRALETEEVVSSEGESGYVKIPLHAAKEAVTGKPGTGDASRKISVKAVEAIAAIPYMSDSERRSVYDALREQGFKGSREVDQQVQQQRPVSPRPRRHERSSSSTAVAPGHEATTLQPPTSAEPASVRRRRLDEFRRELYEERVDRKGRLKPSQGADVPTDEQLLCSHPWKSLKWTANQHGHFARCMSCDLKNVLVWQERHGSFMAENEVKLDPSSLMAIGDSGCRTAVGGEQWHERFQQALRDRGLTWHSVPESEIFKFGAGDPIPSRVAHIYPIGLHGKNSWVRMSVVSGDAGDCPGLIGPTDMARWSVVFRFKEKMMDALGVSKPMMLTPTRHPGLNLLDFGDVREFAEKEDLLKELEQLRSNPYAFAFVQQDGETSSSGEDREDAGSVGSASTVDSAVRELVEDMDAFQAPQIEAVTHADFDGGSEEEWSSCSTTSHEFGRLEVPEEETSGSEVEVPSADPLSEVQVTLLSKLGQAATMTKGKKRRVRSHVRELREAFALQTVSDPAKEVFAASPVPRPPRHVYSKPQRPYKVLEVFTWTMAVTLCAVSRGWVGCEPVSLPRWDLRSEPDRVEAMRYLAREEPDLLVLAWPCTVWSPLQYYGHTMTEARLDRLHRRQQADREHFLSFVHDAVQFQRRRGRAHLGENPLRSRAWEEPFVSAAYEGECHGRTDMCAYGLRRPDTMLPLLKPTRLAGTREIVEMCDRRCSGCPAHAPTLGQFWFRSERRYRPVAEFAGGYTKAFARCVVQGAEVFLDNWDESLCTVYAARSTVPERAVSPPRR